DAKQVLAEIVTIGDRHAEGPQNHGDKHIGGDNADEHRGQQLDVVDEPIHAVARRLRCYRLSRGVRLAFALGHGNRSSSQRRRTKAAACYCLRCASCRQYAACYFASESFSSRMMISRWAPSFFTFSAQVLARGSAALRHSASCGSEIE